MKKILLYWHNFYFALSGKYNFKQKSRILWAFCGINWKIATWLFDKYMLLYAWFDKYPNIKELPDNKIVVSLTSFPARINKVWMVIDSILRQKLLPSKVCLYLTTEEFPNGLKDIPKRLLNYQKYGLEICFRDKNLRSHLKYYYALQEYKNSTVITVDDDIYYNDNTISNLMNLHTKYPNCICSNTIHVIDYDENGLFKSYNDWILRAPQQNPSHHNVALGYNGVLYPPFNFKSEMFECDTIKDTALCADDLWLKANEIISGIKVVNGKYFCRGIEMSGSQDIALGKINVTQNLNDIQWEKLCKHFGISKQTIDNKE